MKNLAAKSFKVLNFLGNNFSVFDPKMKLNPRNKYNA